MLDRFGDGSDQPLTYGFGLVLVIAGAEEKQYMSAMHEMKKKLTVAMAKVETLQEKLDSHEKSWCLNCRVHSLYLSILLLNNPLMALMTLFEILNALLI